MYGHGANTKMGLVEVDGVCRTSVEARSEPWDIGCASMPQPSVKITLISWGYRQAQVPARLCVNTVGITEEHGPDAAHNRS